MKRAFEEFRVNFWKKVQQVADRALKQQPDVSINYEKTKACVEEEIQRQKTAASDDDAACNISLGSNPEQSPLSSPQTGKIFSKSTSIDDPKKQKPLNSVRLSKTSTLTSDTRIEISQLQETLKDNVTKKKLKIEKCLSQENAKNSFSKSKGKQLFEENIPALIEPADGCTSSPEEPKTYPVLFSWIKGGKEVYLTGDFSQWRPIKMAKVDCCEFSLCLYLPEGSYAYNFIVDDVMWYDERMRYVFLIGKRRNQVVVKQEIYEESRELSAEFVNVGDTSTYMAARG